MTSFGYQIPGFRHAGAPDADMFDHTVARAVAAERGGFESVWVMDHFWQLPALGGPDEPILEAYTLLGALAARTERVQLGTLVTGVTYRNPALLAKMVTTLDVISKGRAVYGIGAAWNEDEHRGYGFEFPPIRERMDRLEEALAIAKAMFTEEPATFHGKHYQLEAALNEPRPVQPNGPPILIGGVGEQRTLRIAAKFADMTHWFALGLESLLHKTEVLERYCAEIGRDPSTIERTVGAPVMVVESDEAGKALIQMIPEERRPYVQVGTPDKAAEALRPYIDAGFTGFTFNNNLYRTPDDIARLGEVLRLVTA